MMIIGWKCAKPNQDKQSVEMKIRNSNEWKKNINVQKI